MLIACDDGWLPQGIAVVNARFNTPHLLLSFLLVLGAAPILMGWELRYIIMLGGGLVFIYDLIPLIAAFRLPDKLPTVFARAQMRLSAAQLKSFCLLGMLILLGQGALSFSDIDRTGWALVLAYLILIGLYVRLKPIDPDGSRNKPQDAPESP